MILMPSFTRSEARSLHKLAEQIHEALDREGYWDEEPSRGRQQTNGGGGGGGFGGGGSQAVTRAQAIASMNTSVDNMLRALRGDFRPAKRVKRKTKVSRYHRCVGKHLKALKKKHPRTPHTKLMKRAHAACKKQRKREGW